jgi:hypothetical protein
MVSIQDLYLKHNDGINIEMFEEFSRTHPSLLHPVFFMQQHFMRKIVGKGFWMKVTRRRLREMKSDDSVLTARNIKVGPSIVSLQPVNVTLMYVLCKFHLRFGDIMFIFVLPCNYCMVYLQVPCTLSYGSLVHSLSRWGHWDAGFAQGE